ncbi:MAG: malto-oligosyltrehalose trehalohydrolase [Janthinobacterium lividum]
MSTGYTGRSTRHYNLPFGAEILETGTRFRFFAPAVNHVQLAIMGRDLSPMVADGHGWHEFNATDAPAGTLYRYVLPDGTAVPDPASRFQPEDVADPSEVIDATAYVWTKVDWCGRPWSEAVLYELHVGTFTSEGTFRAAIEKLDHLAELGITAIELMTISDFAGTRNWGYDTVLLYAPDSAYGRPEDLKAFVDAAHARGLMVILDVVYNHFGPEGNYLPQYFPEIFSKDHQTGWGPALNFDGECSEQTRAFVIENALFWLEEYNVDGLRLDAAHAIIDGSPKHVLDELAERVHALAGDRLIHLIREDENNIAGRLTRDANDVSTSYTAQWNHDIDHLLGAGFMGSMEERKADDQGETDRLGKALSEGFVIAAQENHLEFEAGCHVPPNAFVSFLQSHDLVGNRIFGERVTSLLPAEAVRALVAVALLVPQVPMLFMGEEWGASSPFPYFCDFHGDLSEAVQKGRCEQISKLPGVSQEDLKNAPNCQAESTFRSAKLNWDELTQPEHLEWFALYKQLLAVRRERIVPLLQGVSGRCGSYEVLGPGALRCAWKFAGGSVLGLGANLWHEPRCDFGVSPGDVLWTQGTANDEELGPWSVLWWLETPQRG